MRQNAKLAELVGILLGDGSFYMSGHNTEVDIALNTKDACYKEHVKKPLQSITNTYVWEKHPKDKNCAHLRITRKLPVMELLEVSLRVPGNKIKNAVTIPKWIWKKNLFVRRCIRGLIDTDGSVYRLKPQWPNLFQISFKNNNTTLLEDTRRAFLISGFHPSHIYGNRIALTRQAEIKDHIAIVGTKNDAHLRECNLFTKINYNKLAKPRYYK